MPASEIRMIPISQLHHHPDNPRKDLGDVTELAESIKHSGVMQNLTVVPGHYPSVDEFVTAAQKEGTSKAAAKEMYKQMTPDERFLADGYTVVIGNRRLEASKLAGLAELPCFVSSMDKREQMATMLAENMQRADLTMPEQVAGIQQCLDLGMNDADIMKRTGFSRKTYNNRKKLFRVNAGALKHGSKSGLTIEDFIKLSELEDTDREEIESAVEKESADVVRGKIVSKWQSMKAKEFKDKYLVPYCRSLGASDTEPGWSNYWTTATIARWDLSTEASLTEKYFESRKPAAGKLELKPGESLYFQYYGYGKEFLLGKQVPRKTGTEPRQKTPEEIKAEKAKKAKIHLAKEQMTLAEEIKTRHMEWIKSHCDQINDTLKAEGVSCDQTILELLLENGELNRYLRTVAHYSAWDDATQEQKDKRELKPESILADLLSANKYMQLSYVKGMLPEIKVLKNMPHYYSFCTWFGMWHSNHKLFASRDWSLGEMVERFTKDGLRETEKYYEELKEIGYEPAEDEQLLLQWKHPLIRGKKEDKS